MKNNQTETNCCNNCGKRGHNFHQCKLPIISNGVIAFRVTPQGQKEYLMVCRKDTLGFVDFVRGKYSVYDKYYISNMICQMTTAEKQMLITLEFDDLWKRVWGEGSVQYGNEEVVSRDKFNQLSRGIETPANGKYDLKDLVATDKTVWSEPEWGFPKGRRENNESDLSCGLREFLEETGYSVGTNYSMIENVAPFEEIFIGSNYKSYKHKYFLMKMDYDYSQSIDFTKEDPNCEISAIRWMSFLDCLNSMRNYNLEKRKIIICVNTILTKYTCL
jgi:8-oxo-dGTP pyrophosphatase MutT (NUDIX family)